MKKTILLAGRLRGHLDSKKGWLMDYAVILLTPKVADLLKHWRDVTRKIATTQPGAVHSIEYRAVEGLSFVALTADDVEHIFGRKVLLGLDHHDMRTIGDATKKQVDTLLKANKAFPGRAALEVKGDDMRLILTALHSKGAISTGTISGDQLDAFIF